MNDNKGFSLIEILVVIGLIGVLSVMAIPAYNNYRSGANDTVLKSDVGNAYKAYHAYNATKGHYCANLAGAGLTSLLNSETYKPNGFVGYASDSCSDSLSDIGKTHGTISISNSGCVLDESSFKLAVVNEFDGVQKGFHVNNNNAAPAQAGSYCKKHDDSVSTCNDETKCGQANTLCGDKAANEAAGTWVTGGALCN